MVISLQDLYSYNMEQARGVAGNNLITVFMETQGLTLQEAADRCGEMFRSVIQRFLEYKKEVIARPFSSRGYSPDVDRKVMVGIESMERMVVGYMGYSFDSPRYFGNEGKEILKTRLVRLREPMDQLSSIV